MTARSRVTTAAALTVAWLVIMLAPSFESLFDEDATNPATMPEANPSVLDDAERAAFEAIMEYMVESSWLRPR